MSIDYGKLKTGLELIDDQHKLFFKLTGRVDDGIQTQQQFDTTMTALYNYTKFHFEQERQLMELSLYPEIVYHNRMHAKFIRVLDQIQTNHKVSDSGMVAVDEHLKLCNLIVDWFISHIKKVDKVLIKYLQVEAAKNKTLRDRITEFHEAFKKTFSHEPIAKV